MLLRSLWVFILCCAALTPVPAEEQTDPASPQAELRLAEDQAADGLTEAKVAGTDEKIYLHKTSVVTRPAIAEAAVTIDTAGRPAISIVLTAADSKQLAEVTERNQGKRLALLVNGQVRSAPIIRSRIEGPAMITGNFSVKEAAAIVAGLTGGAQPGGNQAPVPTAAYVDLFNGRDLSGWVDVNTSPQTWQVKDGLLVCSGQPIGVMRSAKQYENFILHIEWRHMKPGGNSGVFVWSEGAVPEGKRLPKGMEVQMLELDWVNLNRKPNGEPQDIGYISGELFGAGGLTATPDNPRGSRSKSLELRCREAGQWNVYDVVCVDGTVKLSINGKFVNSIRNSSVRKGYLCLESEGSEIHFRNIRILELPGGVTSPEQTAPVVK